MEIADDYIPVAILTIVGIMFVAGSLFMSRMIRPSNKTPEKLSTYECAEVPVGDTRISYNIQYYLIVIVFLIFDVEVIFMYPWAAYLRDLPDTRLAFFEMIVFVEILIIALAYAWRKEALEWIQ